MIRLAVVAAALVPVLNAAADSTSANAAAMTFGNVMYDLSTIEKYAPFSGVLSIKAGGLGTINSTVLLAAPGSSLNGHVPSACASKVSDASSVMALQYVDTAGVKTCDLFGKSSSIKAYSQEEVSNGVERYSLGIKYGDGDSCSAEAFNLPRRFTVTYVCDASVTEAPTIEVQSASQAGPCHGAMTVTTAAACPTIKATLTGLWVFLSIFCGSIVIYLVGGMIYKNQVYGTSGVESIPNIEFWREFPTNVSIGVRAVWAWANGRELGNLGLGESSEALIGSDGGSDGGDEDDEVDEVATSGGGGGGGGGTDDDLSTI